MSLLLFLRCLFQTPLLLFGLGLSKRLRVKCLLLLYGNLPLHHATALHGIFQVETVLALSHLIDCSTVWGDLSSILHDVDVNLPSIILRYLLLLSCAIRIRIDCTPGEMIEHILTLSLESGAIGGQHTIRQLALSVLAVALHVRAQVLRNASRGPVFLLAVHVLNNDAWLNGQAIGEDLDVWTICASLVTAFATV